MFHNSVSLLEILARTAIVYAAILVGLRLSGKRAIGQMTASEAQERYTCGREKELKALVVNWLNLQGCWIFSQGMHRRTGGRIGVPDILACVPDGNFLAVELKTSGGRLEPAQTSELERIRAAGGIAVVARCLEDVMHAFRKARERQLGGVP